MANYSFFKSFFQKNEISSTPDLETVQLRHDFCRRCGLCTKILPDVFAFGDDGQIIVKSNVTHDNREKVLSASARCPAAAIVLKKIRNQ